MNRELTYNKWVKYIHDYQLNKYTQMGTITYDDTRDMSITCIDKLIEMKLLSEDEHNFEIQDLIQDEINKVLGLDIDDNFEITIKNKCIK